MDKDEVLKQEVKEYISCQPTEGTKDFVVYKVKIGENAFAYVVEHKNELSSSDWIKMYEGTEQECYRVVGYLDSAEPRENRIKELESELHRVSLNEQLAINNGKNFLKQIAELEAKINRMKCC